MQDDTDDTDVTFISRRDGADAVVMEFHYWQSIERINPRSVALTGSPELSADLLIYATGYGSPPRACLLGFFRILRPPCRLNPPSGWRGAPLRPI